MEESVDFDSPLVTKGKKCEVDDTYGMLVCRPAKQSKGMYQVPINRITELHFTTGKEHKADVTPDSPVVCQQSKGMYQVLICFFCLLLYLAVQMHVQ